TIVSVISIVIQVLAPILLPEIRPCRIGIELVALLRLVGPHGVEFGEGFIPSGLYLLQPRESGFVPRLRFGIPEALLLKVLNGPRVPGSIRWRHASRLKLPAGPEGGGVPNSL